MTETLRAVFGSTERRGLWQVPERLDVRVATGSTRASCEIGGAVS